MKENQIKSTVFLIVLIGTMITIYINPNNWIPPILFFILSTGGLIKSINKKKIKNINSSYYFIVSDSF